jgi:hypothetical protein
VGVYDGLKKHHRYTRCRHAFRNISLLRDLTFLELECHQPWATDLKALLIEMKATIEQTRVEGHLQVPNAARAEFAARCQTVLAGGKRPIRRWRGASVRANG